MRNINVVIGQLLNCVPDVDCDLYNRLADMQSSVAYAAPEMAGFWWKQLAILINDEFVNPVEDWEFQILSIFTTLPVEEVKNIAEFNKRV